MNINGLNSKQVEESRKKYGTNEIKIKSKHGFVNLFIESLSDPIIKILIIALAIKLIFLLRTFDWYETVGIVIAIFLASLISTISEYGSEKAFEKLQEDASKIKCKVKREGHIEEINVQDVVVGDIVLLETGDMIPADGIIIEGSISVDESTINGEVKETQKYPSEEGKSDKNFVYKGTVVYSKKAYMQVKEVGFNTVYGRLAKELQEKKIDSPLKTRLRELAKTISRFGYIGAILVASSYMISIIIHNQDMLSNFGWIFGHFLHALTLAVTVIVVAVPEGLPMMVTLVLSSNMKRMLKSNVLVRKLSGIEAAGSMNILFTDKTGTITKGKLEVISYVTPNIKEYHSEEELYNSEYYDIVKKSCVYNNSSDMESGNVVGGNSTDKAIRNFIKSSIGKFEKTDEVPFDSKNKYSSVMVDKTNYIKGSPELIIKNCNKYIDEYGHEKILMDKKKINDYVELNANKGIRVIALAVSNNIDISRMTLVGLILIKDEVKNGVKETINQIKAAGIKVVMITGDNKDTAVNIAREVNILNNELVLTSEELSKLSDDELRRIIPNLKVVARSLPSDKSRLIRIAQSLDLVVGMTGDGVNDAPALKKADIGFAMGSGTEVSKEASDIVILDNDLKSIATAILFGRTIFKSIRKFIIFQLTINICAVGLSILGPFIGVQSPVTVIQMLWINMVMDTFAGLAFSFEPPLKEYMLDAPKKKTEPIMNKYMKEEIVFTGLYSAILCILFLKLNIVNDIYDYNEMSILTAFFGLFIFIAIFNSFNARTSRLNLLSGLFKNKMFLIIIIFIAVVQVLMIYFGGEIFRTSGLSVIEFYFMIIVAITVIPVDFIRKLYLRKRNNYGGV